MRAFTLKCAALALGAAHTLACSGDGVPANGAGGASGAAPVVTPGTGGVPAVAGSGSSTGGESPGRSDSGGTAGNGAAGAGGSSSAGRFASGGDAGFAGTGTGTGGGGVGRAKAKATLVITGKGQPTPGDALIIKRLETYGFEQVVSITDALANADTVTGSDLVVISSSAESGPLEDRLKDIAIPVLCIEDAEFTKMGMASSGGHDSGITQVMIAPAAGALTGDATGTMTISSKAGELGWGTPAPSALVGATMPGDATHAVVFGYDEGAQMTTMKAPARRAGFAIREGLAANLNADGVELFDAILAWVAE